MKLSCLMIAAMLIAGFSSVTVKAASSFKIYDYTTKKTSTYTDKIPKVTLNGTAIGNTKTPGILVDGIALLSYYDIFKSSNIAADCVYNEAKGTVAISKYGTNIVMTLGSKKATVNGKAVTLPVAPRKIKYVASGTVKVLVPSRFVSETLGLGYTWYSDKSLIAIEKHTIQLSYDSKEKFEYTGMQGKVTIDGASVDLGSMPSVITNNTAMLRAKRVFADSSIAAGYSYNKTSKTITLTRDDKKLIMTVGSKTAYINDKEVKLDTAPMIVTNCETGVSYVMVPGSFTATSLGYNYTWNNNTRTSVITSKKAADTPDNSGLDPELGDSGVINETGTVLEQWTGNEALFGKSSNIHELDSGIRNTGNPGYIYYVSRENSNQKKNAETFMVVASTPFEKVTSSASGKLITIAADNVGCTDQTYQMYGQGGNLVNTIGTHNSQGIIGTAIEFEVLPSNYSYELSLSADKMILYVTVYINSVTSAAAGVNTAGDYLTLTGLDPLEISISRQADHLYIDIPDTANAVGDINKEISGTRYISQIFTISSADRTQIIVGLKEDCEYFILENGSQYTLSFQTPGAVQEPEIPPELDKGEYEIVIPKPGEVAGSSVTNEDFYFNNYFVIRIPGDFTQFYKNNQIAYTSNVISGISVSLNGSNETEIKIATSRLQGYEIASDKDNIYVHIGDPRDIYKNIAVLDPGHGGPAKGAQYYGTYEKDVNLKILYTVGKSYFNSDTSKLKVYYTRTTDVDMGLSDRAAFVKKVGADIFVSLHMNAADASVRGTEVFYSVNNNKANSSGLRSQELASILVTNLVGTLGMNSRGVKTENYTVIYKNTVPAVLIELGFLSNVKEHALLTDGAFQQKAAKTIYETLLQVFETYPTGR